MKSNKIILVVLILSILALFFSGCVGSGGGPTVPPTPEFSDDFVLIQIEDPESNIFIIAREDSGETVAGLVEKNDVGNPTKITGAIYTVEQGNAFVIESGIDGLPLRITDSLGNIIKYENYTNSTVDISIYGFNGNILQAPTTIYVDSEELSELKQLYNSINSKDKYDQDAALTILKWVGIGVNWVGCGVSIYATVQTAGLLAPAILKACGSAIVSTAIALTPNDIDDVVATSVGVGSCVVGGQVDSCVSLVLDIGAMVIEQIEDDNHPPTISNLIANPSSIDISQTTTITCFAYDPDGDSLAYHWTKNGGAFIGSTSGSSVTWRAPSTPGTYRVYCEVSDGEGGEDNDSANIIVTESDEDKIRSVCSKLVSALNSKNWSRARSYCINGSEAYNQVSELENSINNIENWHGPGNLNINSNINNIVVNGNYATVYGYFNSTFTAGSYFDENSGSVTGYLEKIDNNWKIYRGIIPNL